MAKTFKLDNKRANELLADIRQIIAQDGDWRAVADNLEETFESIAEWTAEPERVIFRKFPSDGAVIALLPDQYNPRTGMIGSYMELGQHSDTKPDFGDTKPADEHEYAPLLGELKRQGYTNLKVVKRLTIKR